MNTFRSRRISRKRREPGSSLWAAVALLLLSGPALSQTPTVARVVPNFGPAAGSNIVIVTGTGFAAGATVTFGGIPATSVAVVNSTSLTAHPPAHSVGSVVVSVRNPGPQSGSLANAYKYLTATGQFGIQYFPVYGSGFPSSVTDIAAGPDGNLWLINDGDGLVPESISKITTSGAFTNYPMPDPGFLTDIAPGPDGNLWYSRISPDRIGRITPSGVATEFSLITSPRNVTAGPDGALWYTEYAVQVAGRITTSGSITEFFVTTYPHGITLGPDGALWLAGCNIGSIGL